MATSIDKFAPWIGKREIVSDVFDPERTNALRAALGDSTHLAVGDPLPLLHHWLYFWDVRPPAGLTLDGHPARGGFLPAVPLPRRMWAGGRLTFLKPLKIGARVERTSTIAKIVPKTGGSGELVFVTVRHELADDSGVAVIEEQDIVYRAAPGTGSMAGPTIATELPPAPWQRDIIPDPVLLFRYSALTMNSHRIHYDRTYAIDQEAYPGLVVQGPLQATLLIGLARRQLAAPITGFEFRGQQPAFDGPTLHICGEPNPTGATLWTRQGASKTMTATVTCAALS